MEPIELIQQALQHIPAPVRSDFLGVAFEKLQTVKDRTTAEQIRAVGKHVEYVYRRERISQAMEPHDRAATPTDYAELRDELNRLTPDDRAIVAMVLAGYTQAEIQERTQLSVRTIARRLKNIRGQYAD